MTAEAARSQPRSLYDRSGSLSEAWRELKALMRYRELVRVLVGASLAKERRTALGALWWLLDPLLLMFVYVVLIDVILHRGTPKYPLFVLTAVIAWKYFTSSVGLAMGEILGTARVMKQIAFPRSVLPVSAVIAQTVRFAFGLGLVLFTAAAFFGIYPSLETFAVIPVVAVQFLLTLGFALFFATLNVFFRDVQYLVIYVFRIWFYLSPALYTVPKLSPIFLKLYYLNPFATVLPAYRTILIEQQAPAAQPLLLVALASLVILAAGYVFFVRLEPEFNKVI